MNLEEAVQWLAIVDPVNDEIGPVLNRTVRERVQRNRREDLPIDSLTTMLQTTRAAHDMFYSHIDQLNNLYTIDRPDISQYAPEAKAWQRYVNAGYIGAFTVIPTIIAYAGLVLSDNASLSMTPLALVFAGIYAMYTGKTQSEQLQNIDEVSEYRKSLGLYYGFQIYFKSFTESSSHDTLETYRTQLILAADACDHRGIIDNALFEDEITKLEKIKPHIHEIMLEFLKTKKRPITTYFGPICDEAEKAEITIRTYSLTNNIKNVLSITP